MPSRSRRGSRRQSSRKPAPDPRAWSRQVVDGVKQAPSRAMLRAVGFEDEDFAKPQIGIASTWADCHALQHAHRRAGARGRGRGRCRRRQERAVQYHHGVGRHFDGIAGHALLAGVARGHRRFDRDGGRCRGLRRLGRDRRLRQEHARLRDGDRAAEPAGGIRLWRHHPARRPAARHRFGVRGGRRTRGRHASAMRSCSRSSAPRSRARAAAAACTPPTPWPRRSRRWV